MSKAKKIWLLSAAALILIGGILFVGGMSIMKWDFSRLSTSKYETNEYTVTEAFQSISISSIGTDIELVATEEQTCSVLCHEQTKLTHAVSVKDGVLVIETVDTRKWYEHIGIHLGTPRITVYLPKGAYAALSIDSKTGDVRIPADLAFDSVSIALTTGDVESKADVTGALGIKTSTGSITVSDGSVGSLTLSVSTGKVSVSRVHCDGDVAVTVSTGKTALSQLSCKNLNTKGGTGDITLQSVIAAEKLSVTRSTGDVRFDGCDAAELYVLTDTGDVSGSLLSDKVFLVKTDTGDIDVPKTVSGGRCEITTDTGDIKITVTQ